MKRFYENVSVEAVAGGYGIFLDGRMVKTPDKKDAISPTRAMAQAIATEWQAQGDKVDPASMPLGKLLYTALDRVEPRREAVITELLGFAKADMLCYQSDFPADLKQRQKKLWHPLLLWARETHGLEFKVTHSIAHIEQDPSMLDKLHEVLQGVDSFRLTALYNIVGLCSSVCVGLNILGRNITVEQAWAAAQLDEDFQNEQWGADEEARQRVENMKADLDSAAVFLEFCQA